MSSISTASTSTPSGGKFKKGKDKKKSASIPPLQASPVVGAKGTRTGEKATDSASTTAPPTPPIVNSPPRGATIGLIFENGPPHQVPPGLVPIKHSPKMAHREPSPPSILSPPRIQSPPSLPQELPWVPPTRLPEMQSRDVEPRVANEDTPKLEGIPLDIPTCKDCSLPTDVTLSSSDGIQFGAHMRNLELYSGGFLAHVPLGDAHRVVKVEENGTVLSLLLRYMHLCPQPDPKAIPFATLEQLANAVEKYLIYSAMAICKLRMEFYLEQYPAEVLRYAAKNRYTDLANEAAQLTIGFDYKRIKDAFEGDPDTPRRWLEFKEGWRSVLSHVHLTEPEEILHPESPFCSWHTFKGGVCRELGSFDPSTLRKIESIFANMKGTALVGSNCPDCDTRISEWEAGIIKQRDALPYFSTFL